jgi:polyisoprenoid-binding protein YceI
MKSIPISLMLLCLGGAVSLSGEPLSFDFKDPKGVNNVVFKLDAPLEAINGSASGISGLVEFDPDKPAEAKGKIVVAASSLHVTNPTMKQHLHSDQWLDVAKHPEISFEIKGTRNARVNGDTITGEIIGVFSLKGVSKEITIPAKVTYLKDKLSQRSPNLKGDLLVVRSTFTIKRSEFDIKPGQLEDKVADEIEITLSIAGAAKK